MKAWVQVVPGTDADLAVAGIFEAYLGVGGGSSAVFGELETPAVAPWAPGLAGVVGRFGEKDPVPS